MERNAPSQRFDLGSMLPEFSLPAASGETISSKYFSGSQAALVVFSCNHCPYVKGSEAQLIDVIKRYQPSGLKAVAISSNDAQKYPEDSFENMRAKSESMELPYPYLYDETQDVARLFDAACTPECYLFDNQQKLVFHGTINDNPRDPSAAKQSYLAKAIEQVIAGKTPDPQFVHPIGCSIKWR